MRSRVFWRRLATAAGIYGSAVFGFLGTVVAFRVLGDDDFGLLAIVLAAVGFLQMLLDLTAEEALVKFGFQFSAREAWGKLGTLFRAGLLFKLAGAAVAAMAVVAFAFAAGRVYDTGELRTPLLLAALLPVLQAPETYGSAALILRERYDLRGAFLLLAMALRFAGLAIGSLYGVSGAVAGVLVAQIVATAAIVAAGRAALRRFPRAPREPLADDWPGVRSFVARSSVGTGLVSLRTTLGTLIVGAAAGVVQASYFRVAQAPQAGFASLSAPVRLILLTEQTRDFERGRGDLLWQSLRRYTAGAAVLMAAAVPVFWWLMPELVRFVFGREALPAVDAARLILLAAALQLVWGWTKSLPVSIGRPGLRIVAHAVEVAVFVPALVVLASAWGATGAAGAVLLATAAFVLTWTVMAVRLRHEVLAT